MPQGPDARGRRRPARVSAPVRRQRPAGSVPDILMVLAFLGWTVAAVFLAASFAGDRVTSGDAGSTLAQMFAGALAFAALLVFLLGMLLLGESRGLGVRIGYAAALGVIAGILEASLFLESASFWMAIPFALPLLAVRPSREWFLKGVGMMPRGDGLG